VTTLPGKQETMMAGWFMPSVVPQSEKRLFCLPYAGGGASAYRTWLKEQDMAVVAVQLPGRENRLHETPFSSLEKIAENVAEALFPHLSRQYALFGHSLGARIAFETVRHLRRRGANLPVRLFVSGSRAPELPEPFPLHELEDDAFLSALSRYGAKSSALLENAEIRRLFMPMLRADFTADETYVYVEEEPLPIPITAFYGAQDDEATPEEVKGWARHTSRSFSLYRIPGSHLYLGQSDRHLLRHIRSDLHGTA
jgi:surfactin synthase thioesterase subunit